MQQPDQPESKTADPGNISVRQLFAVIITIAVTIMTVSLPDAAIARSASVDYAALVALQGQVVVKITARKQSVSSSQTGHSPLDQLPEELRRYFEQLPGSPSPPHGRQGQPGGGVGSGFIISEDGYIVTNHHVIAGADDIEVGLQNRQSYTATLIGSDARTDLALLKVEASDLPVAQLGDSDTLKVGQWVLAIGSPFGFDYTATQGIVSALSRSLPSNDSNYVPFIQTDVAVNPGNSGGPLFDLHGKVVGVNSQIYTRSGGYMGLSFAIPVDVVKNVVAQLRDNGRVTRGWLGVTIQEVSRELAETFGMDRPRGALVAEVSTDSPAAAAGLQAGDIILSFNQKPVASSSKLPAIVGSTAVNSTVPVLIQRSGKEQTLELTVGELDETPSVDQATAIASSDTAGLTLKRLDAEQLETLELTHGLEVMSVKANSAGAKSSLQKGDVLLSLNRKALISVEDFKHTYESASKDSPLPLLLMRGKGRLYVPLSAPDD